MKYHVTLTVCSGVACVSQVTVGSGIPTGRFPSVEYVEVVPEFGGEPLLFSSHEAAMQCAADRVGKTHRLPGGMIGLVVAARVDI